MFTKTFKQQYSNTGLFVILSLFWAFYHPILQTWWLADDPVYLQAIVEHGIFAHFYQPTIWQQISQANFTPWLVLSLGIDYQLFGLTPFYAYLHHLLAFTLVLILFYKLLQKYFHPIVIIISLLLFIFSTPSSYLAQHLMVRHYVEGLGLSLLAIIFYLRALQTEKFTWALLGSFFYLFAVLAKEIYVPLVIILPCFTIGGNLWQWRKKAYLKMWQPFIFVAVIYTAWRLYMLKTSHVIAGYDNSLVPPITWEIIQTLPQQLIQLFNWQNTWQIAVVITTILLFLAIYIKKQGLLCKSCIFLWLIIAILLIIPVASILTPRYLLLIYLLIIFSFAIVLQLLITNRHFYFAAGLSILLLITQILTVIDHDFARTQAKVEGEFFLYHDDSTAILLNPQNPFWYFQSLQWLRHYVLKSASQATVCYDYCVCAPNAMYYEYADHQQIVKSKLRREQCDYYQPFTIKLTVENRMLSWQLHADKARQYYGAIGIDDAVTGQFFAIPAQGSYSVRFDKSLSIVFKYDATDNVTTYSDVFTLDKLHPTLQWQR